MPQSFGEVRTPCAALTKGRSGLGGDHWKEPLRLLGLARSRPGVVRPASPGTEYQPATESPALMFGSDTDLVDSAAAALVADLPVQPRHVKPGGVVGAAVVDACVRTADPVLLAPLHGGHGQSSNPAAAAPAREPGRTGADETNITPAAALRPSSSMPRRDIRSTTRSYSALTMSSTRSRASPKSIWLLSR